MNASNSPWTPELQATVRRLFVEGVITREIGRQVGMSKNQIIGWLNRHELKGRDRDYDGPTTLDRLRAHQDKMNAARWWPEFVNMVHGTIVLRYPAPLPSANQRPSGSL
jgi:hypothetical protein